jgi:integration host factor subunit alpha
MTLTKAHIVKSIRRQLAIPEGKSSELVETLLELIKKSLVDGDDVLISGFGKLPPNYNPKL